MLGLVFAMMAQAQAAPAKPKFVFEEPPMAVEPAGAIEAVVLHPPFRGPFACGDHPAGEKSIVGDSLGTDCQLLGREDQGFRRLYRSDGMQNADWYSWGADVLAPFDGEVTGLLPNKSVNEPGTRGRPPAGMIQIRRADGVVVVLAHVTDFKVAYGDRVAAGQLVAKVGNNGPSYAPHIHAGAYRGLVPLQIRWDQRAMAKLMKQSEGK